MKKLLIVLFCLFLISCSNKTWYSQGHVDSKNSGTFIVNDSIEIQNILMGLHVNDNDIIDSVLISYIIYVNDVPVLNVPTIQSPKKTSFTEEIINEIQKSYYDAGEPIEKIKPIENEPIEENNLRFV